MQLFAFLSVCVLCEEISRTRARSNADLYSRRRFLICVSCVCDTSNLHVNMSTFVLIWFFFHSLISLLLIRQTKTQKNKVLSIRLIRLLLRFFCFFLVGVKFWDVFFAEKGFLLVCLKNDVLKGGEIALYVCVCV